MDAPSRPDDKTPKDPPPPHPPAGNTAGILAADRPFAVALQAGAWLAVGFLALLLPFAMLLTGSQRPPPTSLIWDFAMGCGFAALALAAMQFALTGRIRALTGPFGADIVYVFHRYLSWGVLGLMLLHFAVLYIWYQPALGDLNPLTARWELTLGRVALVCFGLLIVTSELRKWLRLDYHWWRILHLALAVTGFAAATLHVLGVGNYSSMENALALWLGVTLVWLGFLVWSRLLRPWVQTRNPWRVVANDMERGGVRTLTLRPEGRALQEWKPGQFAWLSVGHSPWAMRENPFTISTAPDHGPEIAFSIKPLGDDSARLAKTSPGSLAYVDGPFGTFSVDREADAKGFVMIAGGVGITPVLSNLHALRSRHDPRPVILIYANPTWKDVPFHTELDEIAQEIDLTLVHVPEDPPGDWQGESGRVDKALLMRRLPGETRDWPHMLCGPPPMLKAVVTALRAMGVPARRISFEIFELV